MIYTNTEKTTTVTNTINKEESNPIAAYAINDAPPVKPLASDKFIKNITKNAMKSRDAIITLISFNSYHKFSPKKGEFVKDGKRFYQRRGKRRKNTDTEPSGSLTVN